MIEPPIGEGTRTLVPAALHAADNPLAELFLASHDGDVHKWHHYFATYAHEFGSRRRRPIRMLEIGVDRGGSLRLWREYFGPDAVIVGVDVEEECRGYDAPADGVHVRIADQADATAMVAIADEFGPFDIVLDDGGHTSGQQLASLEALYVDHVTPTGLYLVEDTHTSYWPEFQDLGPDRTFMRVATELVHVLHEPYLEHRRVDFAVERERRLASLDVSAFAAVTRSIRFYDSIVVFEKAPRALPAVERR